MISQRELREILMYDPKTGVFVWKKCIGKSRTDVGSIAGGASGRYWRIQVKGIRYYGHQLAWFYVHGVWAIEIDHCDKNKINNKLANLRLATRSQNLVNRKVKNSTGYRGVSHRSKNCFSARIKINKKLHRLGNFSSAEEAYAAYLQAAKKLHGEFANET